MIIVAMLALAVAVSLLGIVNTLALGVVERTREIGLLRAAGMTRRQVRRMVRWESVLTAGVGTAIGVALGLGLGGSRDLPAQGSGDLVRAADHDARGYRDRRRPGRCPRSRAPARRASRLDVLHAVTVD